VKIVLQKVHALIFVVVTLVMTSTLVFGLLSASTTISNTGNVKVVGVGVYWDSGCSQEVSLIEWGYLDPGETSSVTVYVRNEGNVAVALDMSTENWDPPEASSYITLSWDYSGQILEPGESIQVTLTLSISSDVQNVTEFDFDIVIAVVG